MLVLAGLVSAAELALMRRGGQVAVCQESRVFCLQHK